MLSFFKRAASEAFTFFPTVVTLKSLVISICPFTIFVEILKAWKKLIWDGSSPVGPARQVKSIGAIAPTLASVGSLFVSIFFLSSKIGASQKIKAILSLS
eukprot:GHVR01002083.1.p2 GENE.GHVR01002083.1~~GHVR01002083.1.p2  ORF type:complete len:100 (+),score=4.01 GHVR01002083.1:3193-3492(+)